MAQSRLHGTKVLARIYVASDDKFNHEYIWQLLLNRAREKHLAGCTVLHGSRSFGQTRHTHTEMDLEGTGYKLPYVLEFVDGKEQINAFLNDCREILESAECVVSEEDVTVHHYSQKSQSESKPLAEVKPGSHKMIREMNGEHTLLRVFVGESDKIGQTPLYMALIEHARKMGLSGATAIRGVAGFGASSVLHSPHLFRLSSDLPMLVEIIDTSERIHAFLTLIRPQLGGALVTEEKVHVHVYTSKSDKK